MHYNLSNFKRFLLIKKLPLITIYHDIQTSKNGEQFKHFQYNCTRSTGWEEQEEEEEPRKHYKHRSLNKHVNRDYTNPGTNFSLECSYFPLFNPPKRIYFRQQHGDGNKQRTTSEKRGKGFQTVSRESGNQNRITAVLCKDARRRRIYQGMKTHCTCLKMATSIQNCYPWSQLLWQSKIRILNWAVKILPAKTFEAHNTTAKELGNFHNIFKVTQFCTLFL